MNRKRIIALFVVSLLLVNVLSMVAHGDGQPNNSGDNPHINMGDPANPEPGSVNLKKTAQWVEGSNEYAQVKLEINAIPRDNSVDVVLVLDTSSSMSVHASTCINPEHYGDYTLTKPVTYQISLMSSGNASWQTVTDDLTIAGHAHVTDNSAISSVESYFVTGLRTTNDGEPVLRYRMASASDTFNAADMNKPSVATNRRFNCIAFGGDTVEVNGRTLTIPLQERWNRLPDPFHIDSEGNNTDSYENGCYFRIDVAKDATKAFADTMLNDGGKPSGNRVSVVTFNNTAAALADGKFFTGSVSDITDMKSAIDGINVYYNQGTSYGVALNKAREMIESRPEAEQSRPVYVLFISDGMPEYFENLGSIAFETKAQVAEAIEDLNQVSDGTYSVGIGLTTEDELREIRAVVKEPGVNFNVGADASELQAVFMQIAQLAMDYEEQDAVVTDIMGDAFDLVPHSAQYPWVVTVDGVEVDNGTVTSEGNTLTWNIGLLPSNATLSYFVKVKEGTPDGVYPTNKAADLTYMNYLGNSVTMAFPVPKLSLITSTDIPGINSKEPGGNDNPVNNDPGENDPEVPNTGGTENNNLILFVIASAGIVTLIITKNAKRSRKAN